MEIIVTEHMYVDFFYKHFKETLVENTGEWPITLIIVLWY